MDSFVYEKIQKNPIKMLLMRQHFFSLFFCALTMPFSFMIRIYLGFSLSICLISAAAERLFCTVGKISNALRMEKEKTPYFASFYFLIIYCQTFLCVRFQNSMVSGKSLIKSIKSILNMSKQSLYGE